MDDIDFWVIALGIIASISKEIFRAIVVVALLILVVTST